MHKDLIQRVTQRKSISTNQYVFVINEEEEGTDFDSKETLLQVQRGTCRYEGGRNVVVQRKSESMNITQTKTKHGPTFYKKIPNKWHLDVA